MINGMQARDAFGDGGFDPFYGPGLNNWDLAAHKEFNIAEGISSSLSAASSLMPGTTRSFQSRILA